MGRKGFPYTKTNTTTKNVYMLKVNLPIAGHDNYVADTKQACEQFVANPVPEVTKGAMAADASDLEKRLSVPSFVYAVDVDLCVHTERHIWATWKKISEGNPSCKLSAEIGKPIVISSCSSTMFFYPTEEKCEKFKVYYHKKMNEG